VIRLNRCAGQATFSAVELDFLSSVSPHLADGVRRGLLLGEALEPDWPDAPGLVVMGEGLSVESVSPEAEHWLKELSGGHERTPAVLLSVAARATGWDGPTLARVRTAVGRWLVLHGTSITTPAGPRAAVIIEPVARARIASVLMAAYGLTHREREITRLVLMGQSTAQIADDLVIAPVTVQQHLKSIFAKTGVHSRRDLICTVFVDHYDPRVLDNEKRQVSDRPSRGGPAPLSN
jgi:DNA-binding CsgD family transcriptional regulator